MSYFPSDVWFCNTSILKGLEVGNKALKLFKAPYILVNKGCSHLQSPLSIANLSVLLSYLLIKHASLLTSQIWNDCVSLHCMCIVHTSMPTCGGLNGITIRLTASIKIPQLSGYLVDFKYICITVFPAYLSLPAKGCQLTYILILFLNSVTQYGNIDLGHHWLRLWLAVWWHQGII